MVSDNRRGVTLLVGAALFFSMMSVLVKIAGRTLPVEMLVLARGVVTLALSWVMLRHQRIALWGNDKPRLVLRGLLGLGGLACFFTAVTRLPLTEVTTIHYLNPVLTAVVAALFLRERIGIAVVVALVLALAGMTLVTRPALVFGSAMDLDALGVAAALLGALFSAFAYVTVRRLTTTDDPYVIVFYFPIVAVPLTLPFAIAAWRWPTPTGWLLLFAIGVVTQLGQVLLTKGLALVPAGRGTTVGYVQIVFASVWGVVLFTELPSAWTVGGALLIIAATLSLLRSDPVAISDRPA
jgi:drug/metabolite transporter (DMT)-like permease